MRIAAIIALCATPGLAWEFTPDPVCTIWHDTGEARLTVTHDPGLPEPYALTLKATTPLSSGPVFALDFGGFAISTTRHAMSDGNTRLTVTDRGFGNVLSGLSAGTGVRALIADEAHAFPTDDAAEAVEAFRRCPEAQVS